MGYRGSDVDNKVRKVHGACGKDLMMLTTMVTALALLLTRKGNRG
jgi:hypothetical protein